MVKDFQSGGTMFRKIYALFLWVIFISAVEAYLTQVEIVVDVT